MPWIWALVDNPSGKPPPAFVAATAYRCVRQSYRRNAYMHYPWTAKTRQCKRTINRLRRMPRCDDVCPSNIPLTEIFRAARRRTKTDKAKKLLSDKWRLLHEAHLAREQKPQTTHTINEKTATDAARKKALEKLRNLC